eukprot:CAMPEP_0179303166 /NCGR_PEP_ID=MMETSP0797-20121207/48439_1 /TAXON_ID=47934 /ORGANISM="Dinophysis acuminata, Strain DAEP01" /LENGTH=404 /DNA_ID=CAMNT_0021012717 /DNA_START=61 /DNA_END=1275 /DNA_ORIENTATION=-
MSCGDELWIVATGCTKNIAAVDSEKSAHLAALKKVKSFVPNAKAPNAGVWKLEVPSGDKALNIGSFDNLIKLTDDLQKYDQSIDSLVHRVERLLLELDPKAKFQVKSQGKAVEFLDYITTWQWDEHKFPKARTIAENVALLMSVVHKLDEESRNKSAAYNEAKAQKSAMVKKDAVMLSGRDMIDVLTPDVVQMTGSANDDFILTEHFTTVCVILPKNGVKEFLETYESISENVVPKSAKQFAGHDDKDGNSLWRVVVFRSAADAFKRACREKRFLARDFEYSQAAYEKLMSQRAEADETEMKSKSIAMALFQAAWSDAMVAWIHIKAMRCFIESVLRFGLPPYFASFVVLPNATGAAAAKKSLNDILGKNAPQGPAVGKGDDDDGEEVHPYVYMSFTPFVVPRA